MAYTPKQQAVLQALAEIYDEEGELMRTDAKDVCAMVGQEALDVFHALEKSGVLQFEESGQLYFMPGDEQIK